MQHNTEQGWKMRYELSWLNQKYNQYQGNNCDTRLDSFKFQKLDAGMEASDVA